MIDLVFSCSIVDVATALIMSGAIPKDSTVLVTGVSGYVGSHVADQLLAAGYKVRGTVRDNTKAEMVQSYFATKYGNDRFESRIVPDMFAEGAFDDVIKGERQCFCGFGIYC